MEIFGSILAILLIVALYVGLCLLLSKLVKHPNGRKPFWWIFFLGLAGAALVIWLDTRDAVMGNK